MYEMLNINVTCEKLNLKKIKILNKLIRLVNFVATQIFTTLKIVISVREYLWNNLNILLKIKFELSLH